MSDRSCFLCFPGKAPGPDCIPAGHFGSSLYPFFRKHSVDDGVCGCTYADVQRQERKRPEELLLSACLCHTLMYHAPDPVHFSYNKDTRNKNEGTENKAE